MPVNYYAVDYADDNQIMTSWPTKSQRDAFVGHGSRRFVKTRREADDICSNAYGCDAVQAFTRGFI